MKFAVVLVFLTASIAHAAPSTARLFMATKGEQVAYLLPVHHIASAVEQDAYLSTVIEPVFQRAAGLVDESANKWHLVGFQLMPCGGKGALAAKTRQRLEAAFARERRHDRFELPVIEGVRPDEFGMFMILLYGPFDIDPQQLPPDFYPRNQVTDKLAARHGKSRQSVEGISDLYRHYCQLSAEKWAAAIEDYLQREEAIRPASYEAIANERYRNALACAKASISSTNSCDASALRRGPLDAFLLDPRNRAWAEYIDKAPAAAGPTFYAFGVDHFAPNQFGPGLLTLLKEKGFSIKLIERLTDLSVAPDR